MSESMEPRTDPGDELSPARFTHRELAQIQGVLWAAVYDAVDRSMSSYASHILTRYRMVSERMGDTPDPVLLAKADRIIRQAGQS